MRNENQHICLTLDNFSGHDIQYQPQNIRLLYFEPNMTSSVQPLDAGIIRCFKARYHREFCLRMIERDETGEHDINLMEGMLMACMAWRQVEVSNIKNCWNHAKIQGSMRLIYMRHLLHSQIVVHGIYFESWQSIQCTGLATSTRRSHEC